MTAQLIPVRALVIDDDPMSRDLLAILLEGEGYAVQSVDSGEAALVLLRRGEPAPDVVLADMQMPGTTGAQLARELRRACGSATVLLAISGSQPPAQTISLFDGFLVKPFRMEQVAAAIKAHRPEQNPTREPEAEEAVKAEASDNASVLNETIYQKLAGSIPAQQLREMYVMCVDDARKRISGMRELAADRDMARFIREAHAIKGSSGMLGATELHRIASELEARGPGNPASGAVGEVNSLNELAAACDRLERMLRLRV